MKTLLWEVFISFVPQADFLVLGRHRHSTSGLVSMNTALVNNTVSSTKQLSVECNRQTRLRNAKDTRKLCQSSGKREG